MLNDALTWISDFFLGILEWLLDLVAWVPKKIWELLLDALASAIEAIPAPGFVSSAGGWFGGIPETVIYFGQFFAVAEGLGMIMSALVLRFLLRRIPIIG
ncbi:MAG: hypothetical protein A3J25_03855 [Pseudomonadales bacterium RIFCSPLOWO2_02_FULL_63_210]|nr:MAG: hypothetical protein A3J25_03855 [Pseudomonadales bacterium RIFCSPLOWO2_02_FULL_63_210]